MAAEGIKRANRIQIGQEPTAYTKVAATHIYRSEAAKIIDDQVKVIPLEDIGRTVQTARQYTPALLAHYDFPQHELHFEQIDYHLNAGLVYDAGTQDGVGTDYIRAHVFPSSASAVPEVTSIKTLSIEAGDNFQAEVMEGGVLSEWEWSGGAKAAWMATYKYFGRQAALQAYTGSLVEATLANPYLFQKSKLYIDAVAGTIGTTLISSGFVSAKITGITGWKPFHSGNGNLYYEKAIHTGGSIKAELTFLHNATAEAQKVLFRSDTPRLFRIKTEGDAIATPGTTYSVRTGIWDFAGVINAYEGSGETEGVNISTISIEGGFDEVSNFFASFTNVNELSAMP